MIAQKGLQWDADNYQIHAHLQREIGMLALNRFHLKKTDRILDVGCGDGSLTVELAKKVPHGGVVSLDVSENMTRKAIETFQHHQIENIDVICENVLKINYREEFDVIFSNAAFHWVPNQQKLYTKISRALKPQGRLLLTVFVEWKEIDSYTYEQVVEEDDSKTHSICPWEIATSIFYDLLRKEGTPQEFERLNSVSYTRLSTFQLEKILHRKGYSEITLEPYRYTYEFSDVEQYIEYEKAVDWVSMLYILSEKHGAYFLKTVKNILRTTPNLNLTQIWNVVFVQAHK